MKCETKSSCGWKLDLKRPDVKLLAIGTSQSCVGISSKIWPINFSLVVCHCSLYLFSKISNLFLVDRDLNHLTAAKCFFFEYLLSIIKSGCKVSQCRTLAVQHPTPELNAEAKIYPDVISGLGLDLVKTSLFLILALAERWLFTAFVLMGLNGSATSFPSFPFPL